MVNRSDELNGDLQKIRAKQTVLIQKKNRLDAETERERNRVVELENGMRHMHIEMTKLNKEISSNSKLEKYLADTNFDIENKILSNLQQREREALQLENDIRENREDKRRIMDDLLDVERQMLYWSKKIELQKEIKEAVDPEVGQEEITRMKKEIHIMEQRLEELKRNQKKKIEEMEKAINKRATLHVKGRAAIKNAKTKASNIKVNIQREVQLLTNEVTKRKKESQAEHDLIKRIQDESMQIARNVEHIRLESDDINQQTQATNIDIRRLSVSRMKLNLEKESNMKISEKYQSIVKGKKYTSTIKGTDMETIELEFRKQSDKKERILGGVESLKKEFDAYAEDF
ncbi:hypothetical protein AKO1_015561, partial [Acrasis kona]